MLRTLLCLPLLLSASEDTDLRDSYDVTAYRLDVSLDHSQKLLSGTGATELTVLTETLDTVQLDLAANLEVSSVTLVEGALDGTRELTGKAISFERAGDTLLCKLAEPAVKGDRVTVVVAYSGTPERKSGFTGFHWETNGNVAWIGTSCQGIGAHTWWPCKSSFFNPGDKHERLYVNITVPEGLTAVSNGKLMGRQVPKLGFETFQWEHLYPCETYAVTVNAAVYEELVSMRELPGIERPVLFQYYIHPENTLKAQLQFQDIPRIVEIYSEAFGHWPFPKSKVGLVETSFWGMEHSTAIAYGSTYPTWCKENGVEDRYAEVNRYFDFILVHEFAHEWWGNAVSANDWGHFWIHEGFATYAEAVYLEKTADMDTVDEYFRAKLAQVSETSSLYRGDDPSSGEAYGTTIYYKGAWVLHTLRQYVDDDELWWRSLREFQMRNRYGNVDTEDFRAVVEELTGRSFERFFREWFYGSGYPEISGTVGVKGRELVIDVTNTGTSDTQFHVPLTLEWTENGEARRERFELDPGKNELRHACEGVPENVAVTGLQRILGQHDVQVR